MKIYTNKNHKLIESDPQILQQIASIQDIVWIDLLSPTPEERSLVETALAIQIPTKEEMQEIEASSRLYHEDDALFMTVSIVKREGDQSQKIGNLTFVLKKNVVLTIRHNELSLFSAFLKTATKPTFPIDHAVSLLLGMLETIIEKIADNLETITSKIESLSEKIFTENKKENHDLSKMLIAMGVQGEINSKTRYSLSSITRTIGFLKFNISKEDEKCFENRFETLALDASDLKDHSTFIEHKINFMLDASLGLINIEQNNIIKIFSIVAVLLLPPTLIASIYGMNFHHMPELRWLAGYPVALTLMFLSAVLPYLYFRSKGWL